MGERRLFKDRVKCKLKNKESFPEQQMREECSRLKEQLEPRQSENCLVESVYWESYNGTKQSQLVRASGPALRGMNSTPFLLKPLQSVSIKALIILVLSTDSLTLTRIYSSSKAGKAQSLSSFTPPYIPSTFLPPSLWTASLQNLCLVLFPAPSSQK